MSPNWLIVFGALICATGEGWGLQRNMAGTGRMDTITDWVWWLEDRPYLGWPVRLVIVAAAVVVVGHLVFRWLAHS